MDKILLKIYDIMKKQWQSLSKKINIIYIASCKKKRVNPLIPGGNKKVTRT